MEATDRRAESIPARGPAAAPVAPGPSRLRGEAPPGAAAEVLVIDLDGTLIRSDMLYETFWAAFSAEWLTPLWALAGLARGKAALKARLGTLAIPDPATLPYNAEVLALIDEWRGRGGKVVLATASDARVAGAIAAHLGVFDAVHASDGTVNLKGPAKAELLTRLYGAGNYTYVGDSWADVAVWQQAGGAVTVNARRDLQAHAEALRPGARHLTPRRNLAPAALRALRPHQWLKNLLIFLPLLAAHRVDPLTLGQGLLAFVAFSLVASSVYVLNDLMDLASDRVHPRKRQRPLASGALPIRNAMALVPMLLVAGLALSLVLGTAFLGVICGYYVLTVAYSLSLKRKALVDIAALAMLYALRVVAGGVATGIELSVWLVAFSVFLFFSLAAVKRQAELIDLGERGKAMASGRGYGTADLPVMTQMATASGFVAVLVLMLYLNDPEVQARYSTPEFLWGVSLIALYWVARMVLYTSRGIMHDDPVVFATRDRTSLLCAACVALLVLGAALW